MKNILIAIRSIFKKGRHNVMKIVSLGIGLAVGLVLIAKVYFEQSYDDFYPDRDRVYQVWAKYQQNGGELNLFARYDCNPIYVCEFLVLRSFCGSADEWL